MNNTIKTSTSLFSLFLLPTFISLSIAVRILGCGGLKEIAGKGRLAGMVGSICFNGILNFNQNDPLVLTGSSKCTITLHTPANPDMIP